MSAEGLGSGGAARCSLFSHEVSDQDITRPKVPLECHVAREVGRSAAAGRRHAVSKTYKTQEFRAWRRGNFGGCQQSSHEQSKYRSAHGQVLLQKWKDSPFQMRFEEKSKGTSFKEFPGRNASGGEAPLMSVITMTAFWRVDQDM